MDEPKEPHHVSIETLARWLSGRLEHEQMMREIARHLIERCPVCRERYEELKRLQKEMGHWDESVVLFEGRGAPELLERLSGLPYEEQFRIAEENEELHGWGVCQLLLKKSSEAVFEDPAKAVDYAGLAVQISAHLVEAYDPNWVLDLRARAFAHLGNARRVLTELRSAEDAFLDAERCLARSTTGNSLVQAEILDLKSSLRRGQRRLQEALAMADQAIALYREHAARHQAGKVLVQKAHILAELGDLDRAIEALQQATADIDLSCEPRAFSYARYNTLCYLIESARFEEAHQLLPEVRDLLREHGKPLDLVRLRWAEGSIALGLGRPAEAEAAFVEVQQAFLERRMGYDAALVSLNLAEVYAQGGRTADLKRLAAEIVPVFESRDVHREAMAAILMFQHACEEETMTAALARHLASLLEKERRGR